MVPLSDAGPTWTVTANVPGTGQDATGQFVQGRKITYQLASGTVGTVFVPNTTLTPDAARTAIEADAAKVSAIDGLKSGS